MDVSSETPDDERDVPRWGMPAPPPPPAPPVVAETVTLTVVPVALFPRPTPTLVDAFVQLCDALEAPLVDAPEAMTHLAEIRGWHANGNIAIAWQHVVVLLGQVIDLGELV